MNLLDHLAAVIPMLGLLIFLHELGHFLVAKACGVRVLKFSLGFGPPVGIGRFRMRWVRDGTEYVIAWFPLGGFVKMLGEQLHGDDELDHEPVLDASPDEYLNARPTWQKLAITFAGPFMNLVFPIAAFALILWFGIPKGTAVIGMVELGSPAAQAQLEPGDRIVSVDGTPAEWWGDVAGAIRDRKNGAVELEIERDGEMQLVSVPVETRSAPDEFGGASEIGWIGLGSRRLPTLVGIPTEGTVAADAGLRSGDRIVSVDGREVDDWEALRAAYEAVGLTETSLEISRLAPLTEPYDPLSGPPPEPVETKSTLTVPALGDLDALGVIPASILVRSVQAEMPAGRAGLEPGDLILAVDGRPVGSFSSFADTVRASQGRTLEISYARNGVVQTAAITPEERSVPGPLGIKGMDEKIYLIGITHTLASLPGAQGLDRERNPLVAVPRAAGMTIDMTVLFMKGLGKLASGEVGADKLAGPIGIAEIAREALNRGWEEYLLTMILISINLGILNLLPIPILDGGQALIYAVEGIKRSPISLRSRERVQTLGLTMLMMLMGLAFWNDLSRHWSSFVEWLRSTGL